MKRFSSYILLTTLIVIIVSLVFLYMKTSVFHKCLSNLHEPLISIVRSCFSNTSNERSFKVGSVSDKIKFLGPYNDVLGVTFQYMYTLTEGANFSEFGLQGAKVIKLPVKDKDFIVVTKDNKTISLPVIGVLGFKDSNDSSFQPILVRLLGSKIKTGDIVGIHATYINPNSTLPISQIQEKLFANVTDSPFKKEIELQIRSREYSKLNESKILETIYNNNTIVFNSSQMIVTSLELNQ